MKLLIACLFLVMLCGCESHEPGYAQGCLDARKELADQEWNKGRQRGYDAYMAIHNQE